MVYLSNIEPFGFFSQLSSSNEYKKFTNIGLSASGTNFNPKLKTKTQIEVIQEETADKIENYLKSTFSNI